jgi:hypothetical protein
MVDDAEKFSSFSKSKKLALGISVGLIVLVLAFFAARRQLEQHLTALIEAKLVKVEGLSIKLGRISLGLSAVHIDQIAIKPAGREDGPGLLMNDVRVNLNRSDGSAPYQTNGSPAGSVSAAGRHDRFHTSAG